MWFNIKFQSLYYRAGSQDSKNSKSYKNFKKISITQSQLKDSKLNNLLEIGNLSTSELKHQYGEGVYLYFQDVDFSALNEKSKFNLGAAVFNLNINDIKFFVECTDSCKNIPASFAMFVTRDGYKINKNSIVNYEKFNGLLNRTNQKFQKNIIGIACYALLEGDLSQLQFDQVPFSGSETGDLNFAELKKLAQVLQKKKIKSNKMFALIFNKCDLDKNFEIEIKPLLMNANVSLKIINAMNINAAPESGFGGIFNLMDPMGGVDFGNNSGDLASMMGGGSPKSGNKDGVNNFDDWLKQKFQPSMETLKENCFCTWKSANLLYEEFRKSVTPNTPISQIATNTQFKALDLVTRVANGAPSPFMIELRNKYKKKQITQKELLGRFKKILDSHVIGLDQPKEAICQSVLTYLLDGEILDRYILLVGPPGCGKTLLAKAVENVFQYLETGDIDAALYFKDDNKINPLMRNGASITSLANITSKSQLAGSDPVYQNSSKGSVLEALLDINAHPMKVLVLDELDKLKSGNGENLVDVFISLCETIARQKFRDEWAKLDFNLSKTLFIICTANNKTTIPAPVLDRFNVIDINYQNPNEMKKLVIRKITEIFHSRKISDAMYEFPKEAFDRFLSSIKSGSGRLIVSIANKLADYISQTYETTGQKIIFTIEIFNQILKDMKIDLNEIKLASFSGSIHAILPDIEGGLRVAEINATPQKRGHGFINILTLNKKILESNSWHNLKSSLQDLITSAYNKIQNHSLIAPYATAVSAGFTINLGNFDVNELDYVSTQALLATISCTIEQPLKSGYYVFGRLGVDSRFVSPENPGLDQAILARVSFILNSSFPCKNIYVPKNQEIYKKEYMQAISVNKKVKIFFVDSINELLNLEGDDALFGDDSSEETPTKKEENPSKRRR
jgi:MoxR-like ATPase